MGRSGAGATLPRARAAVSRTAALARAARPSSRGCRRRDRLRGSHDSRHADRPAHRRRARARCLVGRGPQDCELVDTIARAPVSTRLGWRAVPFFLAVALAVRARPSLPARARAGEPRCRCSPPCSVPGRSSRPSPRTCDRPDEAHGSAEGTVAVAAARPRSIAGVLASAPGTTRLVLLAYSAPRSFSRRRCSTIGRASRCSASRWLPRWRSSPGRLLRRAGARRPGSTPPAEVPDGLNVNMSFSRPRSTSNRRPSRETPSTRLHRAGTESRRDRVAVDVGVLEDEVAARASRAGRRARARAARGHASGPSRGRPSPVGPPRAPADAVDDFVIDDEPRGT